MLYQFLPRLADDEYAALEKSIREHGIQVPIVVDESRAVIDGHHRKEIADRLGIECPRRFALDLSDEQKRTLALSLNLDRRHLTREQKRSLVEASIKADPHLSDRQHAERTGVSPTTAGTVRSSLEQSGDVSKLDTRTDSAGRTQPATKPPTPEPTFVSATDALAEINATPDSAPEADATAHSGADQPEGETPAPASVESERGPATPSDAPRPPADLDASRVIGADETVNTTTGEIVPTIPRPTPAPKPERSGEQQNAEENSRTLASSLIFLLAFQHPTQRDTARTEWEVGRSAVAPTNRDYVTPDRMRQAAEGLFLLADEWESLS